MMQTSSNVKFDSLDLTLDAKEDIWLLNDKDRVQISVIFAPMLESGLVYTPTIFGSAHSIAVSSCTS